jgi:SAM-dependent methyltransferase
LIDLSSGDFTGAEIEFLKGKLGYQPFILPGPIYTGAGLSQIKNSPLRWLQADDPNPEREEFLREWNNQAQMYEDLISFTVDRLGGVKGMTYLDLASNAGYFCYRMSQLGAIGPVGIDIGDYHQTYEVVNRALGTDSRFAGGHYDARTHQVVGVDGDFDIVSNIAFMCHSSDPTFLLAALANRAKKALLIFSKFSRDDEYRINYPQTTHRYGKREFPLCFDAQTDISDSLLKFGLTRLGFATIEEIPRRPTWLPRAPTWRAFLAIR